MASHPSNSPTPLGAEARPLRGTTGSRYTPLLPTIKFYDMEAAWIDCNQRYIRSFFDSMPKCVAAVIAENDEYTSY
ncbi:hypothetical protein TNCV_745921 [Trichonephila clavipes]|nr:hypothetical protein TNCV_745921 [Trichonephila clavipes]